MGNKLIKYSKIGNIDAVKLLLEEDVDIDRKNFNGRTALIMAAAKGNYEIVKILISRGAKLDIQETCGLTALSFAASNGHIDVVKLLIDKGANLELENNTYGLTALLYAVINKDLDMAKLLLQNGANSNVKPKDNLAGPLAQAILDSNMINNNIDMIRLLIESKADISSLQSNVLSEARRNKEIIQLLDNPEKVAHERLILNSPIGLTGSQEMSQHADLQKSAGLDSTSNDVPISSVLLNNAILTLFVWGIINLSLWFYLGQEERQWFQDNTLPNSFPAILLIYGSLIIGAVMLCFAIYGVLARLNEIILMSSFSLFLVGVFNISSPILLALVMRSAGSLAGQ